MSSANEVTTTTTDESSDGLYDAVSADAASASPPEEKIEEEITSISSGRTYRLGDVAGTGSSKTVRRVLCRHDDRLYALSWLHSAQNDAVAVVNEAEVLRQLKHPHVVAFEEIFSWNGYVFLVCELIDTTLKALLSEYVRLSAKHVLRITKSLLSALEYLKSRCVVHGDIKLDNIFMKNGEGCLADFGLSQVLPKHQRSVPARMVNLTHLDPEAVAGWSQEGRPTGYHVSHLTDIYAVGVVVAELLMGLSRSKSNKEAELHRLRSGGHPTVTQNLLQDADADGDGSDDMALQQLREVVRQCLLPQKDRPDAGTLLGVLSDDSEPGSGGAVPSAKAEHQNDERMEARGHVEEKHMQPEAEQNLQSPESKQRDGAAKEVEHLPLVRLLEKKDDSPNSTLNLEVVEEALEVLKSALKDHLDAPLVILAVEGPSGQGKSTWIAECVAGLAQRAGLQRPFFPVGDDGRNTTRGIHVWPVPIPLPDGRILIVLDVEGTEKRDPCITTAINVIAAVLSSDLVLVAGGAFTLKHLGHLDTLTLAVSAMPTVSASQVSALVPSLRVLLTRVEARQLNSALKEKWTREQWSHKLQDPQVQARLRDHYIDQQLAHCSGEEADMAATLLRVKRVIQDIPLSVLLTPHEEDDILPAFDTTKPFGRSVALSCNAVINNLHTKKHPISGRPVSVKEWLAMVESVVHDVRVSGLSVETMSTSLRKNILQDRLRCAHQQARRATWETFQSLEGAIGSARALEDASTAQTLLVDSPEEDRPSSPVLPEFKEPTLPPEANPSCYSIERSGGNCDWKGARKTRYAHLSLKGSRIHTEEHWKDHYICENACAAKRNHLVAAALATHQAKVEKLRNDHNLLVSALQSKHQAEVTASRVKHLAKCKSFFEELIRTTRVRVEVAIDDHHSQEAKKWLEEAEDLSAVHKDRLISAFNEMAGSLKLAYTKVLDSLESMLLAAADGNTEDVRAAMAIRDAALADVVSSLD